MGFYAMNWAFSTPIKNPGAKYLLLSLAEHARDEGEGSWTCFPSVERLATRTAQGVRTVESHLAWLVCEGWISRHVRRNRRQGESAYFYTLHRSNAEMVDDEMGDLDVQAGQKPAKMASARYSDRRQSGAGHPPISTSKSAKLAPPYIEEPVIESVNEPDLRDARDIETRFAEFWSAYPNKVEERGARAVFLRLISRGDASADVLIDGAKSYAATVRDRSQQFIKSPTNWLDKGCWADGSPSSVGPGASGERSVVTFAGPADVWDAVAGVKGSDWAMSYLAPCAWSASSRTLSPRTGFAGRKLRDELGGLLRQMSVAIVISSTTIGAVRAR